AKLGGIINLATSTQTSAGAQIFNATTNTFQMVGSMHSPRESAGAPMIVLPNHLSLIVGGQDCEPATVGGQSGVLCTALNTAELYDQSTQKFTLSTHQMTTARTGPSLTVIAGSGTALDGQVLIAGGSNG